jgi:hypothetical protein
MKYVYFIKFLPLVAFMLTARLGGMDDIAWKNAFIVGGLCTIMVVAFHLYKKIMFDRLMLGVNLFLLVGACAFLSNMYSLLYYFGTYKGPVFLVSTFVVGLCTTIFSKAGFVGVDTPDRKKIYTTSLRLLFFNFVCIIWSIMTNDNGFIISVVVPFVALRVIYDRYGKQLLNE